MNKETILFLLALFLLLGTAPVPAQETAHITVRGSGLNNGVVILQVVKGSKAYQLQCNQGASGCLTLNNGNYQMVELPKNFGMYECRDVEIYPDSAITSDKDKKLGEYCLVEK